MRFASLSLRARLVLLVVASLVPLLGFTLVSQQLAYRDAVARTAERVTLLARGLAYDIEQELDKNLAVLEVLALAPVLLDDDLVELRRRLDRVRADRLPDVGLVLLEPGGRQLVNTLRPPDAPLPVRRNRESLDRAIETGRPVVSDLRDGQGTGRPVITIEVPVKRTDGSPVRILSLVMTPDVFDTLLRRQALPQDWMLAVFDRQGTIVAHLPGGASQVGRPAAGQLPTIGLLPTSGGPDEGEDDGAVLSRFAAVQRFGWSVAIGVPRAELVGPAFAATLRTLLVGGVLFAAGVALALALGRSITGPIARLRALAAAAPVDAEVALRPATGLRETDDVAAALASAELQRRRSEQSFRYLFERSPLPNWVYATDTMMFLAVNEVAVATYGYSRAAFLAMRVTDIHPDDERPRVVAVAQQPDLHRHTGDWHHVYNDRRVVDVEAFSHAMTFEGRPARIVVALDVTARKAAEAQLVHAQKMEAVGELTGGLAHDFNNLLSVMIGNLGLLRDGGPDDPDFDVFLDEALVAARRGADLTRSLLAFARRQPLRPVSIDINQLVTELSALLRRVLGEPIEIDLSLEAPLWPVVVDPNQLEAALVNLATNARDAMPRGGRLRLATSNRRLGAGDAGPDSEIGPGDYVMIEVGDNGSGMSPEVRARVFEPFFTTKGRAQGTGLGLSMVFGFIKQSGGHVAVDSALGVGTTFRLYLPRARVPAESAALTEPVHGWHDGRGRTVAAEAARGSDH